MFTSQINLSDSQLCGLNWKGEGTYTVEGIAAIADALKVNASVTRVDVRLNGITGEGASQLSAAVLANANIEVFNEIPIKEMRANSLTELDLNEKSIGTEGGMVVAGLLPAMASLTTIDLSANSLGDEGVIALCDALNESKVTQLKLEVSDNRIESAGFSALRNARRREVEINF